MNPRLLRLTAIVAVSGVVLGLGCLPVIAQTKAPLPPPAATARTATPMPATAIPTTGTAAPAANSAPAGGLGALTGGNNSLPLDITAENGIEWQQENKVYIARGNAVAKRGNVTLKADTLSAYYRPVKPAPGAPPPPPKAPTKGTSPEDEGNTEVWRVVAEGHVVIFTPTQTVVGDKGIYDIDQAVAVLTGNNLKLTTPQDVVTARDTLEWYDAKQLAVARGNGVATRGDRKIHGDVLVSTIVQGPNQQSRITRVDGTGHVVISTKDEVAEGSRGVYNLDTDIATLIGNVVITRGDNVIRGEYAVLDTARNISRLLPVAPADSGPPPVVEGLLVRSQPPRPNNPAAAPTAPSVPPAPPAGKATPS